MEGWDNPFHNALSPFHDFIVVKDADGSIDTYGYDGRWHKNLKLDRSYVNVDRVYSALGQVLYRDVEAYRVEQFFDLPDRYVERAFDVIKDVDQDQYDLLSYNCKHAAARLIAVATVMYTSDLKELRAADASLRSAVDQGDGAAIRRAQGRVGAAKQRLGPGPYPDATTAGKMRARALGSPQYLAILLDRYPKLKEYLGA
jgi:hypothetical protein